MTIRPPQVFPVGPRSARIMIVGEAPDRNEVTSGRPFVGASGAELDSILNAAAINRDDCFVTNVARHKPPNNDISHFYIKNTPKARVAGPELEWGIEQLEAEIADVQPDLILALGDTAWWALTGERGITKWRGTQWWDEERDCKIVPTYHPAAILRQYSWRAIAVHDVQRAARWLAEGHDPAAWKGNYPRRFTHSLVYSEVMRCLDEVQRVANESEHPVMIAGDIETRGGHIICHGMAWSPTRALCIPFATVENPEGCWTIEQEVRIIRRLIHLFQHPNLRWIYQNGLYDCQYYARYWGAIPTLWMDTMLAHHTLWPELPKGLDFLSSMYCGYHQYWKDDGKEWDTNVPEEQLWVYNCMDCVRTLEAAYEIDRELDKHNLRPQCEDQHSQFPVVLSMMIRGVRTNQDIRKRISLELFDEANERQQRINHIAGQELNPGSSKQMKEFFYEQLGLPVQYNRKTKKPSLDKNALKALCQKQPVIRPLVQLIEEKRSIGVFRSTFIEMPLDSDGRLRTSYNIAGTTTFRWSSSRNAFGSGGNLQNIPKGSEDATGDLDLRLPNIKRLFLPDAGYTIIECDLDRADAQVVAAEARDDELLDMFEAGVDIHTENAKVAFNITTVPDHLRHRAKAGVHLTNYGGKVPTLSTTLGITRHEADVFQKRWFSAHPGIVEWHDRIERQIQLTRSVENRFGYRMFFFDRPEKAFTEALAWVPQSTVALVIDKGMVRIHNELPEAKILLQVHDSVVFQIRSPLVNRVLPQAMELLRVPVPYERPLIIGVGAEASTQSWGDVKKVKVAA